MTLAHVTVTIVAVTTMMPQVAQETQRGQSVPRVDQLLLALKTADALEKQLSIMKTMSTHRSFREPLKAARAAATLQVLSLQQAIRAAATDETFRWADELDELDESVLEALRNKPDWTAEDCNALWRRFRVSQAAAPQLHLQTEATGRRVSAPRTGNAPGAIDEASGPQANRLTHELTSGVATGGTEEPRRLAVPGPGGSDTSPPWSHSG